MLLACQTKGYIVINSKKDRVISAPLCCDTKTTNDDIDEQIDILEQEQIKRLTRNGWFVMDNLVRVASGDTRIIKHIKTSLITLKNY